MSFSVSAIISAAALMPAVGPGISSLDLSQYQLVGRHPLPAVAAAEASAVTYNWDTDTLFVLGDEGDAIVEVNKLGVQQSVMTLTNFADTEALTYIGGGQFVMAEERLQDVFRLTYAAGGSVSSASLPTVSLGPTVGNVGIEGISFDPSTGKFIHVKEKTPQAVIESTIDFTALTASSADLFIPSLGVLDLSDVQVLTTVPSLAGTADEQNLLVYSQESALLMEVTRAGVVLSTFSFAGLAGDAEGVTIDRDGNIYVVGEAPELFVLAPIPTPASMALAGLALAVASRRRR